MTPAAADRGSAVEKVTTTLAVPVEGATSPQISTLASSTLAICPTRLRFSVLFQVTEETVSKLSLLKETPTSIKRFEPGGVAQVGVPIRPLARGVKRHHRAAGSFRGVHHLPGGADPARAGVVEIEGIRRGG